MENRVTVDVIEMAQEKRLPNGRFAATCQPSEPEIRFAHEREYVQKRIREGEAIKRERAEGREARWCVRGNCNPVEYSVWRFIKIGGRPFSDFPEELQPCAQLAVQHVERELKNQPSEAEVRFAHEQNYVLARIWEREAIERERTEGREPGWFVRGDCDLKEYRAWRLQKVERLSFGDIGQKLFRKKRSDAATTLKRRAQLAVQRVERELGRESSKREKLLRPQIYPFGADPFETFS